MRVKRSLTHATLYLWREKTLWRDHVVIHVRRDKVHQTVRVLIPSTMSS
jgi:hypothetical protein